MENKIISSTIYVVSCEDADTRECRYTKGFQDYEKAEKYFYEIIGRIYTDILYDDNKKEDNQDGYVEGFKDISMVFETAATSMYVQKNVIEKYIDFGWCEVSIIKVEMGE